MQKTGRNKAWSGRVALLVTGASCLYQPWNSTNKLFKPVWTCASGTDARWELRLYLAGGVIGAGHDHVGIVLHEGHRIHVIGVGPSKHLHRLHTRI